MKWSNTSLANSVSMLILWVRVSILVLLLLLEEEAATAEAEEATAAATAAAAEKAEASSIISSSSFRALKKEGENFVKLKCGFCFFNPSRLHSILRPNKLDFFGNVDLLCIMNILATAPFGSLFANTANCCFCHLSRSTEKRKKLISMS